MRARLALALLVTPALLAAQSPAPAPAAAATTAAAAPNAAPPAPVVLTAEQEARVLAKGKEALGYFMRFQADSLIAVMDPSVVQRMGGKAPMEEMFEQIQVMAGLPDKIIEQKLTRRRGKPQFWAELSYQNLKDETVIVRFIVEPDGRITGFGANPRSQAPAPDPQ